MEMFNKKGQNAGLVTGLVFGVASLVIAVLISLVIVSTLNGAGLLEADSVSTSYTILSEKDSWANTTDYILGGNIGINGSRGSYVITGASNNSASETIAFTNYTLDAVTGNVTNSTETPWHNVTYNYTYIATIFDTTYQDSADDMTTNLTEGIGNVSDKIPTVLLVAAIVLILGVLALLVATWQKMRIGGGGI